MHTKLFSEKSDTHCYLIPTSNICLNEDFVVKKGRHFYDTSDFRLDVHTNIGIRKLEGTEALF